MADFLIDHAEPYRDEEEDDEAIAARVHAMLLGAARGQITRSIMQHPKMALHNRNLSLPAGGASSTSQPIDSQATPIPEHAADIIAVVDAPSLTAVQLPSGQTVTYAFVESNNQDLSSPVSTTTMGVQTGTGSTVSGGLFGTRPKFAGGRYWGLKITASSTAAASALSVTLQIVTQKGAS